MVLQNEDRNGIWENIVKHYEFIQGAQMSNSFILLMALNCSKEAMSTTQLSEVIANHSKGKIYKASGALKDSLENRLRKKGYIVGNDIPNIKRNHKPIRMTLYKITPKGRKLLRGWTGFLSTFSESSQIL
jgi:DNA-binding PadR family transcriptional regulator